MSETIKEALQVRDGDIIELDGKRGTVRLVMLFVQKYEKSFVDRPDAHPSVILDIVTDDGENVVRELPIHEPVKTFYERDYNTYQIRIEEGEIVSIYRINHIPETGECCDNLVAKFFDGDLTAKYKLAQLLCVELEKNS